MVFDAFSIYCRYVCLERPRFFSRNPLARKLYINYRIYKCQYVLWNVKQNANKWLDGPTFPGRVFNERHMYVLEIGNIVKSIKILIAICTCKNY